MVLLTNDLWVLEDGDGDPAFIHMKHKVRVAQAEWFPGQIMEHAATLVEVVGGPYQGRYVTLISRVLQPIDEQMAEQGFANVVARPIRNSTSSFDERTDLEIGGMTVLRRIDDVRFGR
jgi:hypothetical protein